MLAPYLFFQCTQPGDDRFLPKILPYPAGMEKL